MRMLRWFLPCLLAARVASAADAPRETAPEKTGLAVGEKAPGFTLRDQQGRAVSLETLLQRGPVAVVFHRSADW